MTIPVLPGFLKASLFFLVPHLPIIHCFVNQMK